MVVRAGATGFLLEDRIGWRGLTMQERILLRGEALCLCLYLVDVAPEHIEAVARVIAYRFDGARIHPAVDRRASNAEPVCRSADAHQVAMLYGAPFRLREHPAQRLLPEGMIDLIRVRARGPEEEIKHRTDRPENFFRRSTLFATRDPGKPREVLPKRPLAQLIDRDSIRNRACQLPLIAVELAVNEPKRLLNNGFIIDRH